MEIAPDNPEELEFAGAPSLLAGTAIAEADVRGRLLISALQVF